jgi:hypothetical protein
MYYRNTQAIQPASKCAVVIWNKYILQHFITLYNTLQHSTQHYSRQTDLRLGLIIIQNIKHNIDWHLFNWLWSAQLSPEIAATPPLIILFLDIYNINFYHFNLLKLFTFGFNVLYCSKAVLASLKAWDGFGYYIIWEKN